MQWFRHDSTANADAKLIKLRIKYGMEGYGLYWYCLELIAKDVGANNITFELEHDAEIIAHQTGIHYERVQEMMLYMVKLGLFEQGNGTITCLKLAKRLDERWTRSPELKQVIKNTTERLSADSLKAVAARIEENRIEDKRKETPPISPPKGDGVFERFWEAYPKKTGKGAAEKAWQKIRAPVQTLDAILEALAWQAESEQWTKENGQFVPNPATYLNQRRWEDEQPIEADRYAIIFGSQV